MWVKFYIDMTTVKEQTVNQFIKTVDCSSYFDLLLGLI